MARISESPEAIKDRLEALITGGREEALASKAINKIESEIKDLKKTGHKHKGQLQKLESTRSDLEYELDKAKREIDQVQQSRTRLRKVKARLSELKENFETNVIQRKNARQAAEVQDKVSGLEERFGDLTSRTNNIKESKKAIEKMAARLVDLPEIDKADVRIADEQEAQRRYLESKRDAAEQKVNESTENLNLANPGSATKALTIVMSLCTVGLTVYWYGFTAMAETGFIVGAGASLLLAILSWSFWSSKRKTHAEAKADHDLKRSRFEEIRDDLRANQTSLDTVLGKYKFKTVEVLRGQFEERSELEKDLRSEENRLDNYLDDKTVRDLEEELKTVTRELAIESEKLRELKLHQMSPEDLAALESKVNSSESEITKLESEEKTLDRQLDFAESGIEHQASLEERLEEVNIQIERKMRYLRVLEITRDYVDKARKDVLKSTLKLLDDETSEILNEVTGGRYSKVRFDRQSLKFEVFSGDRDAWVEPERYLSRGTIDQLYLAARLALVRILSEERNPVIILDDPFVTFDSQRRANALEVLKRLSDKYQIFLLTCHDHYDSLASETITLT
jgi:uncharacterized protein YhaN